MKRYLIAVGVCLAILCMASLGLAKEKKPKPGPMTGTWECTSHGGSQGDTPFTLYLEAAQTGRHRVRVVADGRDRDQLGYL